MNIREIAYLIGGERPLQPGLTLFLDRVRSIDEYLRSTVLHPRWCKKQES